MKRYLQIILVMVVLFALCAQVNVDKIRDGAIRSVKNVKTYRFKLETNTMFLIGNNGAKIITGSRLLGKIDRIHRRMYLNLLAEVNQFGTSRMMGYEMFVKNYTAYIKMVMPNGTVKWMKRRLNSSFWNRSDVLDMQVILLKSSKLEYVGERSINGTKCYVLRLNPDFNTLAMYLLSSSVQFPKNGSLAKKYVKSVDVEEWISERDYRPMRTTVNVTLKFPMTITMGNLSGSVGINEVIRTNVIFYGFDEPVNVTLPNLTSS